MRETPALSRGKAAVVYFSVGYGALCLWAGAYVTAVELAVPPSRWLQELRLFDPSTLPSAGVTGPLNASFADWFVEPGAETRYALCQSRLREAMAQVDTEAIADRVRDCRTVIEDALRSNPASSPLWYHHARMLAAAGAGDDEIHRSLRMSYRLGPREGWLVQRRLPFVLARWEQLSDELRGDAESDVAIMLKSWEQTKALAQIYGSHSNLRGNLGEMLERLATPRQKSTFVWLVEKIMKGEPLP